MKPIEVIIKYLVWHFGSAEEFVRYVIEHYTPGMHLSKNPPKSGKRKPKANTEGKEQG